MGRGGNAGRVPITVAGDASTQIRVLAQPSPYDRVVAFTDDGAFEDVFHVFTVAGQPGLFIEMEGQWKSGYGVSTTWRVGPGDQLCAACGGAVRPVRPPCAHSAVAELAAADGLAPVAFKDLVHPYRFEIGGGDFEIRVGFPVHQPRGWVLAQRTDLYPDWLLPGRLHIARTPGGDVVIEPMSESDRTRFRFLHSNGFVPDSGPCSCHAEGTRCVHEYVLDEVRADPTLAKIVAPSALARLRGALRGVARLGR